MSPRVSIRPGSTLSKPGLAEFFLLLRLWTFQHCLPVQELGMPAPGQWWIHRRTGKRVRVARVGPRRIAFVATRAAGTVRITYRTGLPYFVRTYRPAIPSL